MSPGQGLLAHSLKTPLRSLQSGFWTLNVGAGARRGIYVSAREARSPCPSQRSREYHAARQRALPLWGWAPGLRAFHSAARRPGSHPRSITPRWTDSVVVRRATRYHLVDQRMSEAGRPGAECRVHWRSRSRSYRVRPSCRSSIRRTRRAEDTFGRRFLWKLDLRDGPGRVDEPDVAEGLGEIAQELSADGIDLLSKQTDVVDEGGGTFEDSAGPSSAVRPGPGPGPARRCTEGTCLPRPRASRGTGTGTPVRDHQ